MSKLHRHRDLLFSTLAEITSLIVASNDRKLIFAKVLDCCLAVLGAERVYLLEMDGDDILRYSKSATDGGDEPVKVEKLTESRVLREWMMKEGQVSESGSGGELALDLPVLVDHYLEDHGPNRMIISAPLMAKRSMFGLLVAIHPTDGGIYAPEDVKLVTILANQAAIALENRNLYQKLEKEAITDGLTGVYNYRFLINALETETLRARRFQQVFCVVMLDVDNLKQYNDRLGHLSGSQALRDIAMILRAQCREIDTVCKYGGDEFAVLLPQTDIFGAEVVTRRVIDSVREHHFDDKHPGLLTCSAGISSFPHDGKTGRELIASADKVLYQVKRTGKNRVLTTRDLEIEIDAAEERHLTRSPTDASGA